MNLIEINNLNFLNITIQMIHNSMTQNFLNSNTYSLKLLQAEIEHEI